MQAGNIHYQFPFLNKFVVKTLFLAVSIICIRIPLMAQHYSGSVDVHFPQGNYAWNPGFKNNGSVLNGFIEQIRNYMNDSSYVVLGIDCFSYASPEGAVPLNDKIANNRGRSISGYLHEKLQLRDGQVKIFNMGEDWNYLQGQIGLLPVPCKWQVLDVIDAIAADDAREYALKRLDGGKSWSYMIENIFPQMRKVTLLAHVAVLEPEVYLPVIDVEDLQIEIPADEVVLHFDVEPLHTDMYAVPEVVPKYWYVKTNVAALGLMVANVAMEADLAKGFSLTLPVYYSGCNYFSSRTKFRVLAFQPELRYWFKQNYCKFYCGVHAGLGWYNIATGNGWRIQDRDGSSPSIGGGFSAGYRTPQFGKRWHIEFAVGAGIYSAEYDKFHNERNGQLYATCKKTYIGLDQVCINLVYKLNCKNRRSGK